MAVLINFKICDNAEECGGVAACSTGALSWNDKNKTIKIDNSKCTSCGACEKACEVHAIAVADDDKEYAKLQKEIYDDPRKLTDLIIDRYGAQPIFDACLIGPESFDEQVAGAQKLVVAELFSDDSIECMLKSIPIKQLFDGTDIKYRKVRLENDELQQKYGIKQLPALIFFCNGKLLGKIEGYYTTDGAGGLREQINKILK
ncbi:MAG: 4Fe-4S binding protein [Candidatus Berkelbacteria bacterium]